MNVYKFTEAYAEFIKICLKKGCKFSVGSDAHSAGAVGNIKWSLKVFNKVGITLSDLFIP